MALFYFYLVKCYDKSPKMNNDKINLGELLLFDENMIFIENHAYIPQVRILKRY